MKSFQLEFMEANITKFEEHLYLLEGSVQGIVGNT